MLNNVLVICDFSSLASNQAPRYINFMPIVSAVAWGLIYSRSDRDNVGPS